MENLGLCMLQCIPYYAVKHQETTTFTKCPEEWEETNPKPCCRRYSFYEESQNSSHTSGKGRRCQ